MRLLAGTSRFVVLGVALCLATAGGLRAAAQGGEGTPESGPGVKVIDLGRMVADIAREFPTDADISETFYGSTSATVHLHVLGFEQTAPLHIHRITEEATVIVSGAPIVSAAYGRRGKRESLKLAPRPGALIFSPPFTGHEWFNPDTRGMQANLVFAAPPFDGNFYLKEADRRLLKGIKPTVIDPEPAMRSFLASGQPYRFETVPMQRERLISVLVKVEADLSPHPASPTLLYVTRGAGVLVLDAGRYPIHEKILVEVPARQLIKFVAKPGSPLAVIAFRPEA